MSLIAIVGETYTGLASSVLDAAKKIRFKDYEGADCVVFLGEIHPKSYFASGEESLLEYGHKLLGAVGLFESYAQTQRKLEMRRLSREPNVFVVPALATDSSGRELRIKTLQGDSVCFRCDSHSVEGKLRKYSLKERLQESSAQGDLLTFVSHNGLPSLLGEFRDEEGMAYWKNGCSRPPVRPYRGLVLGGPAVFTVPHIAPDQVDFHRTPSSIALFDTQGREIVYTSLQINGAGSHEGFASCFLETWKERTSKRIGRIFDGPMTKYIVPVDHIT